MRRGLVGVALLAVVAGCGSMATAARPAPTPPAVYAMVINSAQRPYAASGPLVKAPGPGQEYLALDVTLLNTGADPLAYNPLDFKVKDRRGYEYATELAVDVAPRLRMGTLAPGEIVSGGLAFLVPVGADGLTLRYARGQGTGGPWIAEPIAP